MELKAYFETTEGMGVLSTADADGNVDAAIYARPHVVDDETIAFIMRPRRSYQNLQSNPKAAYLYMEKTAGYLGKRLYLVKTHEEHDPAKIEEIRRSHHGHGVDAEQANLVVFRVEHVRPLVGDVETD